MTSIENLKGRLMDNPEFRDEYARADLEFSVVEAVAKQRIQTKKIAEDQP